MAAYCFQLHSVSFGSLSFKYTMKILYGRMRASCDRMQPALRSIMAPGVTKQWTVTSSQGVLGFCYVYTYSYHSDWKSLWIARTLAWLGTDYTRNAILFYIATIRLPSDITRVSSVGLPPSSGSIPLTEYMFVTAYNGSVARLFVC